MEQTNNAIAMLDLMTRAGFCVKDGTVLGANKAAQQYGIASGKKVSDFLLTGMQEYSDFTDGCLYLTLLLNDLPFGASVTKMDGFDVFLLEEDEDRNQLQGMALAAQELRQPLGNVMTIADHLFPMTKEQVDPQLEDQLARINRGLFQMLRIVSNMSDAYRYSQDNANRQETRDVSSIINELFLNAQPLVAHTGMTLNYTALNESIYCLVDSEKIERAISNLLSNALKFSAKGSTIDAKLSRKGNMLYITIQDAGSGMEGAIRSNVYNRYRRQPGIEDGRYGIGLGMVLIRSAAAAHGGTVLIEQSPDRGTRLTMTLSIRQSSDAMVRNSLLWVDYAGERDHRLLELSESLPAELYKKENF